MEKTCETCVWEGNKNQCEPKDKDDFDSTINELHLGHKTYYKKGLEKNY